MLRSGKSLANKWRGGGGITLVLEPHLNVVCLPCTYIPFAGTYSHGHTWLQVRLGKKSSLFWVAMCPAEGFLWRRGYSYWAVTGYLCHNTELFLLIEWCSQKLASICVSAGAVSVIIALQILTQKVRLCAPCTTCHISCKSTLFPTYCPPCHPALSWLCWVSFPYKTLLIRVSHSPHQNSPASFEENKTGLL